MIKVENLTKRYAGYTAIKDLSFEVERGEIVGFLGPNGAGKSTTMKILTCFLPATSGRATVAGYDVFSESVEVRNHLGYMPENVPLYTDLRVNEYLEYRAALKGLSGRKLRTRVGEVKELTSLVDVQHKIINTLSKGYRQRVGLADALVADPDLLILDEPTIGLDPNQIRQVRDLIRNLGQRHTILLSTHILPEVEITCSRVIILHKGRIEASDTPQNLLGQLRAVSNIRLEANTGADNGIEQLQQVPGIKEVTLDVAPAASTVPAAGASATVTDPLPAQTTTNGPTGDGVTAAGTAPNGGAMSPDGYRGFLLRVEVGADPRAELFRLAVERKWTLRELARRRATLEDVFVEITHAE
jgi:ABC-2 type transport system ATP-binding protein